MLIPCLSADSKLYNLFIPDEIPEATLCYSTEAYLYNDMLIVPEAIDKNNIYYDLYCNYMLKYTTDGVYNLLKNFKKKIIEETVIYASLIPSTNYSHFTMQCLGTLLLARNNHILNNNIKIIAPNSKKFHNELYDLFDLQKYNFINPEKDTLYIFKSIFYSNLYFNTTLSKNYKQFDPKFVNLFNKLIKYFPNKPTSKKIYLTRINEKNRVPINEQDVIEFFKKRNFNIIDCAQMTVKEQINTIRNADTIVSTHGANGANLVYKEADRFKFVEIFGNRFVSWHTMILKAKNCDYSSIKCQPINSNLEAPFKINLELLDQALNENTHIFSSAANTDNDQLYMNKLSKHLNQITSLRYTINNYLPERYPKNSLMTWHRTWLTVSDDLTKLIHLPIIHNLLFFFVEENKISIFIKDVNKYICKIDNYNGNIKLSSEPYYFDFIYNKSINNISIIKDNKYLSAKKNGSFSFIDHNLIWEHFFIKLDK